MNRVDELAYDLECARTALADAKEQVDRAEEALLAEVPFELEGSKTTTSAHYKITTTGKLTRAVDAEQLERVRAVVPPAIFARVIRMKPDLSLRDLRYIEANEPDLYRAFALAITTKPAKTAIKVERLIIED